MRARGAASAGAAAYGPPPHRRPRGLASGLSDRLDIDAIRRDVESLSAMVRDSAGPGERASAAWLAERLRGEGIAGVRVEPFRSQSSWASAHVPHYLAGLAGAVRGGGAGAALAGAALASYDLEFSGRRQWLRPLLPAGEGANVVGRVPSRGEHRRTLVLVAHHDAARTGLLWASALARAGRMRAARTGRSVSAAAGAEAAFALVAAGSLAGRRLPRLAGGALLALATVLALEVSRNETVPGASDNATGAAAALALAARFARDPLEHTEVVALFTGCEESGMGGMAAWLAAEGASLDPAATLVVGLDTLGAGHTVVANGEGPVRTERYSDEDLKWVDRGSSRAGLPWTPRFRIPAWTDPVLARITGLPAVSILSIREGGFTNYHLPTDSSDRVDWGSVRRCARLAEGIVEAFDAAAA